VLEYVASESASTNPKRLEKDLRKFTGGHAVALQRFKREDGTRFYEFFDPNAGVYEIEPDALKDFFDTLYACYGNFHAEEMNRRKKAGAPYVVTAFKWTLSFGRFTTLSRASRGVQHTRAPREQQSLNRRACP
jgi:hypothetical protein